MGAAQTDKCFSCGGQRGEEEKEEEEVGAVPSFVPFIMLTPSSGSRNGDSSNTC